MTLLEAARAFIVKTEHHRAVMKNFLGAFERGELTPGDSRGATTHGDRERARIEFERLCSLASTDDAVVAAYRKYLEAVRQPIPAYFDGDESGKRRVEEQLQQHRDAWAHFAEVCGAELS